MKRLSSIRIILGLLVCLLLTGAAQAQKMDQEYADRIKKYTTDPRFINEMVDHLPESDTVPSPLQHFGDIIGAPGRLHYTDEIYGYLRALADASPRVLVRSIGRTEEDREMIEVVIGDQQTLQDLETYRGYLNQLADPRSVGEDDAREIIEKAKPIYYITAGLHSPETGSPEMLMELAYRLAVDESPMIQNIRNNVIFVFTPVAEADGRDRVVDTYRYRAANRDVGPGLSYWGHYVAHDNNRDGFGLALALTRNILNSYLHWKATVMHDLHESVSYLYASTGTGPYNEYIDPITIDEWHNISHEEVTELTSFGMPGVWTHGFYTGWAANYLIWIANNRNAIGRFYETFGNSVPDTLERKLSKRETSREWYRPSPPLEKVQWSLRNNTNYMQSAVLVALNYTANHRKRFVQNFYTKSRNAITAGRETAPFAYVIPTPQKRSIAAANLVNLLRMQGLEVHRASTDLSWPAAGSKEKTPEKAETSAPGIDKKEESQTAPAGSYVIRMDQPYRALALILLDKQKFPADADPPYDDTGWTLPLLRQVTTLRVEDPAILEATMELVDQDAKVTGSLTSAGSPYYLVNNNTDDNVAVLRFQLKNVKMKAAETGFEVDGRNYSAGTLLIESDGNGSDLEDRLTSTSQGLGLEIGGVASLPEDVSWHDVEVPRVALVHTWVSTPQDAGWWHYAFDEIGIPYTYLSEQDFADTDLSAFDVIVMPNTRATPQTLVAGTTSAGDPIPWKNSSEYRHLGVIDESDDVRRGMGYEGLKNLKEFIEKGGVFIAEGYTSALPIDMAITRRVGIRSTRNLVARGTVVQAEITDHKSPITYGYDDKLAVYFNQAPVFQVNKETGEFRVPDWLKEEIWTTEVPRVVVNFAKKDLLLSGALRGEGELSGSPAVVDVPVGKGHVVLFANRPFWRWETHGSHALVFNTMLHWNDLRVGWPERPKESEDEALSGSDGAPIHE